MIETKRAQQDQQLFGLIILISLMVAAAYYYMKTKGILLEYTWIVEYAKRNIHYIAMFVVSILINTVWIVGFVKNYIFYGGQGQKLAKLNTHAVKVHYARLFKVMFFSMFVYLPVVALLFTKIFLIEYLGHIYLYLGFRGVLSLSVAFPILIVVLQITISKMKEEQKNTREVAKRVPAPKEERNIIDFGTIGEDGEILDDTNVKKPKRMIAEIVSLRSNWACFGGIDAGKTSAFILPAVKQVIKHFTNYTMFVLDHKNNLIDKIEKEVEGSDVERVYFTHKTDERINPLYHPEILKEGRYQTKAFLIKEASLNVLGESSSSSFWEYTAFNLVKTAIVLCYTRKGYFTFITLRDEISKMFLLDNDEFKKYKEDIYNKAKSKKFGDEELFVVDRAITSLEEFTNTGKDLKGSIVTSATVFLDLFMDYETAQIYCPIEDDITIHDFDDLVYRKCLVYFSSDKAIIAKTVGTFFKTMYFEAVLGTLKNKDENKQNVVALHDRFFIADEYQDITSLKDPATVAKAREAGLVMMIATQSVAYLIHVLKSEKAVKGLLANFKSKVFMQSTDSDTVDELQRCIGKVDEEKLSYTQSELTRNATRNYMVGNFESDESNITQSVSKTTQRDFKITSQQLARLTKFEAYIEHYDGVTVKFYKGFLKPTFASRGISHVKLLKIVRQYIKKMRDK